MNSPLANGMAKMQARKIAHETRAYSDYMQDVRDSHTKALNGDSAATGYVWGLWTILDGWGPETNIEREIGSIEIPSIDEFEKRARARFPSAQ